MKLPTINKKTGIWMAVFAGVAIVLTIIAMLVGWLVRPNNHNEQKYGTYSIRLVGWEGHASHVRWASEAMSELSRLGPTFRVVNTAANIDVVNDTLDCTLEAGVFQTDTAGHRRVVVDPACVSSELEFKTVLMHEVAHSLGMGHVCRVGDSRSDCSTVGRGLAIMNPTLLEAHSVDAFETVDTGSQPTWQVQALDIAEFRRVNVNH